MKLVIVLCYMVNIVMIWIDPLLNNYGYIFFKILKFYKKNDINTTKNTIQLSVACVDAKFAEVVYSSI